LVMPTARLVIFTTEAVTGHGETTVHLQKLASRAPRARHCYPIFCVARSIIFP
jgi:hypothetical protein